MKKNRIISEKLNIYAEAIKPKGERVLAPALRELETSRYRQKKPANNMFGLAKFASSLAAVFLVLVVSVVAFNLVTQLNKTNNKDNEGSVATTYAMSQLKRNFASDTEIANLNKQILRIETSAQTVEHSLLSLKAKESGSYEIASVLSKYKVRTDSSMDEIVVIADIKKGLSDYKDVQRYKEIVIDETLTVNAVLDFYEKGEFYSKIYFNYQDIDYYVFIMSPLTEKAETYIKNLFTK